MRPRSLLAVAVSAVLGVAVGVASGLLIDRRPAPIYDPLELGLPLVNQPCNQKSLVLAGWGDANPGISTGLANYLPQDQSKVKYLKTAASCHMAWTRSGRVPTYAAYFGPFDNPSDACHVRMTPTHAGTEVVRLVRGATTVVQCACYFAPDSLPALRLDAPATPFDELWTRALKGVLTDLGRHPAVDKTRVYNRATAAEVRRYQTDKQIPPTGVVDEQTWGSLLKLACGRYRS